MNEASQWRFELAQQIAKGYRSASAVPSLEIPTLVTNWATMESRSSSLHRNYKVKIRLVQTHYHPDRFGQLVQQGRMKMRGSTVLT